MGSELAKVVIRGYEKAEEFSQQNKAKGTFVAMFNPANFDVGNSFNFDDSQSDGETGSEQKFKNLEPREFTYTFLIDASGASGVEKDVVEEVQKFRQTTGFEGKERRPYYLSLSWGTFTIRCVLKKMEIKYTLFQSDGKPVRATITGSFSEYKTPQQQLAENPSLASKLTRLVPASGEQSLDLLAHQNYGDSDQLVALARENGLDSLRAIDELDQISLPPAKDLEQGAQQAAQDLAGNALGQGASSIQQGLSNLF